MQLKYQVFNGPTIRGKAINCPHDTKHMYMFAGHRGFGYCKYVEKKNPNMFYFTAIREPISRMISYYDYNKKTRSTFKYRNAFGKGKALNELIIEFNSTKKMEFGERLLRYSGSQQTRFLCGYDCFGPTAKRISDEEMLKRALKNLKRVDALTTLKNMNDLFLQLRFHTEIVPIRLNRWPHANTIKLPKSKVSPQAYAILKEWSYNDEKLYNQAKIIGERKTKIAKTCLEKWHHSD